MANFQNRDHTLRCRVTREEKEHAEQAARNSGAVSLSDYLRDLVRSDMKSQQHRKDVQEYTRARTLRQERPNDQSLEGWQEQTQTKLTAAILAGKQAFANGPG